VGRELDIVASLRQLKHTNDTNDNIMRQAIANGKLAVTRILIFCNVIFFILLSEVYCAKIEVKFSLR
jgi:hypothetical protein